MSYLRGCTDLLALGACAGLCGLCCAAAAAPPPRERVVYVTKTGAPTLPLVTLKMDRDLENPGTGIAHAPEPARR